MRYLSSFVLLCLLTACAFDPLQLSPLNCGSGGCGDSGSLEQSEDNAIGDTVGTNGDSLSGGDVFSGDSASGDGFSNGDDDGDSDYVPGDAVVSCGYDPYELNNSVSTAYHLDLDVDPISVSAVVCTSDQDWYKFSVDNGFVAALRVHNNSGVAGLTLIVTDCGSQTYSDSCEVQANGDIACAWTASGTGGSSTYCAGVSVASGFFSAYAYNFSLQLNAACTPDVFEDNDSEASSRGLTPGATESNATICPMDNDWFKSRSATNYPILSYRIHEQSASDWQPVLTVTDCQGVSQRLACQKTASAPDDWRCTVLDAQINSFYCAQVEGNLDTSGLSLAYNYAISSSHLTSCGFDSNEVNNALSYATPLSTGGAGGTADTAGSICKMDRDWFNVDGGTASSMTTSLSWGNNTVALGFNVDVGCTGTVAYSCDANNVLLLGELPSGDRGMEEDGGLYIAPPVGTTAVCTIPFMPGQHVCLEIVDISSDAAGSGASYSLSILTQ